MIYFVYGITDCPACLRSCALLMERGVDYVFIETDFARTYRDELKEEFDWPTFPMIVKICGDEEEFVGGYDELRLALSHDSPPT